MPSDASIMEIPNDFKELLELFNKHKVEYLIVGGYALAFHGAQVRSKKAKGRTFYVRLFRGQYVTDKKG